MGIQSAIEADQGFRRVAYPVVLRDMPGDWDNYVAKYTPYQLNGAPDVPGITILDQSGRIAAIHHGSQNIQENVTWAENTVDALLAR